MRIAVAAEQGALIKSEKDCLSGRANPVAIGKNTGSADYHNSWTAGPLTEQQTDEYKLHIIYKIDLDIWCF